MDKESIDRPKQRLDAYYSHIVHLKFVTSKDSSSLIDFEEEEGKIDPFEVFTDLFNRLEKRELTEKECEIIKEIIEQAQEEEEA